MKIARSEHFTYKKLIKFTLPTIIMMIFTSIYGVVDGIFISNVVGNSAFASVNLIMPVIMILDALFVYLFKFGVKGAALATIISQFIGASIPLIYFIRKNNSLLKLVKTKFELKPILKACSNGSSEMVTNASLSIINMLYNY